jgi:hypothetical protein
MKLNDMRWRTRGALLGFAFPTLFILGAIASSGEPLPDSFLRNVIGFTADLLGAPASPLINPSEQYLSGPWVAFIAVELVFFWTVFGGIVGFAFESRTPRRQQLLICAVAALYLGYRYYDYFIVNPPKMIAFTGSPYPLNGRPAAR